MKFYGLYVLWREPLIVSCFASYKEEHAAFSIKEPACILFHPTWLWTARSLPWFIKVCSKAHLSNKSLYFIASAEEEVTLLKRLRLPHCYSSICGFINERDFFIGNQEKRYDALYAASMSSYKRLHLAAKIKNLFIQTYGTHKNADGEYDLAGYCPAVAHADHNKTFLSPAQVLENFQRAHVGLALSEREGAMLAFVEYLLCGMPVVSTPARGGREAFFHSEHVTVAQPNAEAIAQAVSALIHKNINPEHIREAALATLFTHRRRLCMFLHELINEQGGQSPGTDALYQHLYEHPKGIFQHYVHRHALEDSGIASKDNRLAPKISG